MNLSIGKQAYNKSNMDASLFRNDGQVQDLSLRNKKDDKKRAGKIVSFRLLGYI